MIHLKGWVHDWERRAVERELVAKAEAIVDYSRASALAQLALRGFPVLG